MRSYQYHLFAFSPILPYPRSLFVLQGQLQTVCVKTQKCFLSLGSHISPNAEVYRKAKKTTLDRCHDEQVLADPVESRIRYSKIPLLVIPENSCAVVCEDSE